MVAMINLTLCWKLHKFKSNSIWKSSF